MTKRSCFVLMPISDSPAYDSGHFGRVYEHLIKPACVEANLEVTRADDVKNTNYIILDILHRIVTSDIVLCDLSDRNPNVLYELGIRQAFDLPVVLTKDSSTDRIFDIQGFRTLEYDPSLRIDSVTRDKVALTKALVSTSENHSNQGGSLIRLLSIEKAELKETETLSDESSVLLSAISDIADRLYSLEAGMRQQPYRQSPFVPKKKPQKSLMPPNLDATEIGREVLDNDLNSLGILEKIEPGRVTIRLKDGNIVVFTPNDKVWTELNAIPF